MALPIIYDPKIYPPPDSGGGGGGVTSITATTPIVVTPSPITNTGVISHANSGVTPATVGDEASWPVLAVNVTGHTTGLAIGGLLQQWVRFSVVLTFISATSFSYPAASVVENMTAGSSFRIASGSSNIYGLVTSAVAAAGTVTIVFFALSGTYNNTFTNLYYGIISPVSVFSALPQTSAVSTFSTGGAVTSNSTNIIGKTGWTTNTVVGDIFSNFAAATGIYTTPSAGYYRITAMCSLTEATATYTTNGSIFMVLSAGTVTIPSPPFCTSVLGIGTIVASTMGILKLASGVSVQAKFTAPTFASGVCALLEASFSIEKLYRQDF